MTTKSCSASRLDRAPRRDPQAGANRVPLSILGGRVPDLRGGQRHRRRRGGLRRRKRVAQPEDDGAALRRGGRDDQLPPEKGIRGQRVGGRLSYSKFSNNCFRRQDLRYKALESDFDRVVAETKLLGEGAAKGTPRIGKP